jgi:hypothetical protein
VANLSGGGGGARLRCDDDLSADTCDIPLLQGPLGEDPSVSKTASRFHFSTFTQQEKQL